MRVLRLLSSVGVLLGLASPVGAASPIIQVAPPSVDFGTLAVLSKKTIPVTIGNVGTGNLLLKKVVLVNPMPCDCMQLNDAPTPATVVGAGSSVSVRMLCAPQVVGTFRTQIEIDSDDPTTPHLVVPIVCAGEVRGLQPDPFSLEFGTVVVGRVSAPKQVTLTVLGSQPVDVGSVTLTGSSPTAFRLDDPGRFTIKPGEHRAVNVYCSPGTPGNVRASMVVVPAGVAPQQIKLGCTGGARQLTVDTGQSPAGTANFDLHGPTSVGVRSSPITVTVRAEAYSVPLRITDIQSSSADFEIDDSRTNKGTTYGGGSTTFRVTFHPTTEGLVSGTINVRVEDEPEPLATVSLRGTGFVYRPSPPEAGCSMATKRPAPIAMLLAATLGLLLLRRRRRDAEAP